ncbi:MAG: ABC transporter ATP-binding protein [Bdellovibrionales bacterium]
MKTEIDNEKLSFKTLLKFIFKYIDNKSIWAFIFVLALVYVTLGRSLPILFGRSIDLGILPENLSVFKKYCLLFLTAGLFRAITGFALYYGIKKESNRIAYNVRKHIFEHVLALGIHFFDKNPSGKILTRVANDTRSFKTLLGDGVIGILLSILELASILIALLTESPLLSIIIFISFPLSVYIGLRLAKVIQKEFFQMKNTLSSLNTYLADTLNGFYVIKTYKSFESKDSHFTKVATDYYNRQIKVSKIYALLWPQLDLFQLLSSVLCFATGTLLIQKGMMNIGSLVAFTLLIQGFFHPLRYILESINQVQNGLTSGKRIESVIEEPIELEPTSNNAVIPTSPSIIIQNLDFSYEPGKPIFQNYNLKILPGVTTALTGRTGSGKTTLVSLMQRLYTPDSGKILINDIDIMDFSSDALRKDLCVVRQEDFIFSGSLAENIALSPPEEINYTKIQEALEFSGITKPYSFKVDSSGGNLSPGERQLLSFARIHYLSPKVLIFDEATSFIDEETEALIQEKSKKLFQDKTVIIIAHKKTTIEMCEHLVAL